MSAQLLAELERIYMLEINSEEYEREIVRFSILHHSALLQALRSQGEPIKYERKFMGFWFACDKSFYERRDDLPGIEFRALGILLAPPNERAK